MIKVSISARRTTRWQTLPRGQPALHLAKAPVMERGGVDVNAGYRARTGESRQGDGAVQAAVGVVGGIQGNQDSSIRRRFIGRWNGQGGLSIHDVILVSRSRLFGSGPISPLLFGYRGAVYYARLPRLTAPMPYKKIPQAMSAI